VRSSHGRHGDGEAGYWLTSLSGDEDDLFEKVIGTVRVDEGYDEVLVCSGGGLSSGDSGTLAGMIGFPEDELRFGEILGLDDAPFILLDHGSERFGHAAETGLGGRVGGGYEEGVDENPFRDAHGIKLGPRRRFGPSPLWGNQEGTGIA